MREMAHASLFHWLQREDCDPSKISVGLWLVSRVHAVLGNGGVAAMYAEECLEISQVNALPPFYLGYAFEAAARAARERGAEEEFNQFLEKAEAQLEKVAEQEERALLAADLEALKA